MVSRFTLVGDGAWVSLGTSEDGFEMVGAASEIVSSGFMLRDDEGGVVAVPAGAIVRLWNLEHARRRSLDYVDPEGFSRTAYTFELPPGSSLFTRARASGAAMPYRGEPVRFASGAPLVLFGAPQPATAGDAREARRAASATIVVVALAVILAAVVVSLSLAVPG